jgi:hypothetical protein
MSKMGNYVVSLQESAMMPCPDCDGDGRVEVEYAVPHNFNRDVGYLDTRMEDCETCSGYGEIEREDEDE